MLGQSASISTHIAHEVERDGYCFVSGSEILDWLACSRPSWAAFAASWGDLERDQYMGDGGRYRYRRHASYTLAAGGSWTKNAHRPHIQAVEFNQLNGGIERWFAPIAPAIADGPVIRSLLSLCARAFLLDPSEAWLIEAHQFRIMASSEVGKPTPEGLHRDGVDFVFIGLIERHNIAGGVTRVVQTGTPETSHTFELLKPGDSLFLVDTKAMHEVTPVRAAVEDGSGHRDVIVLTFAKLPFLTWS